MAQVNSAPGTPLYVLPTVANVDYDGVPEGVLNTRETQPAVALGVRIAPGFQTNWPGSIGVFNFTTFVAQPNQVA